MGLTNSVPIPDTFDNQAGYADVNARMSDVTSDSTKPASKAESGTTAPPGSDVASGQHLFSDQGPPVVPVPTTDLLAPETFYTYQIVFVPDLSQKYGLRIKGGVGEIRAAMNLVNGWMFTGLGPYYMKDSSTAQNILANGIAANFTGRGVADVIKSLGDLKTSIGPGAKKRESGEVLRGAERGQCENKELGPTPTNAA